MARRPVCTMVAVLALASALVGCRGPQNVTAPKPPQAAQNAPTLVQESQVTPATTYTENQYGGSNQNIPGVDDEETCLE